MRFWFEAVAELGRAQMMCKPSESGAVGTGVYCDESQAHR